MSEHVNPTQPIHDPRQPIPLDEPQHENPSRDYGDEDPDEDGEQNDRAAKYDELDFRRS